MESPQGIEYGTDGNYIRQLTMQGQGVFQKSHVRLLGSCDDGSCKRL